MIKVRTNGNVWAVFFLELQNSMRKSIGSSLRNSMENYRNSKGKYWNSIGESIGSPPGNPTRNKNIVCVFFAFGSFDSRLKIWRGLEVLHSLLLTSEVATL